MGAMPIADEAPPVNDSGRSFDMPREEWLALFADLSDGSMVALERLYDLSAKRLYALGLWLTGSPEDAADVVADTMVRVAQHRDRLRRVNEPRAWLLSVSRRLSLDILRRRSRRPSEPIEAAELVTAPDHDPARALDARRVSALLTTLPVRHREVVYLRHFADCSFADIGRIVGAPTFTAASRYRLAIRRLRQLLEGNP